MGVVKVTSLLIKPESALEFIFGVRAQAEMKIWCVTGMCMLKVVSSETDLGVKGWKFGKIGGFCHSFLSTIYRSGKNVSSHPRVY